MIHGQANYRFGFHLFFSEVVTLTDKQEPHQGAVRIIETAALRTIRSESVGQWIMTSFVMLFHIYRSVRNNSVAVI